MPGDLIQFCFSYSAVKFEGTDMSDNGNEHFSWLSEKNMEIFETVSDLKMLSNFYLKKITIFTSQTYCYCI